MMDDTVCISGISYSPGKSMHPTIILPVTSKWWDMLSSLIYICQPVEEKDNSGFKEKMHSSCKLNNFEILIDKQYLQFIKSSFRSCSGLAFGHIKNCC